jgi:hypothetical protein
VTVDASIAQICSWYAAQCNGDWEHKYGVRIDSLDNPGWQVAVDVAETDRAGTPFAPIEWQGSDRWLTAEREGDEVVMYCGPRELDAALEILATWLSGSSTSIRTWRP